MSFVEEYEIISFSDFKAAETSHTKQKHRRVQCPTTSFTPFAAAIKTLTNGQHFRKEHFKRRKLFLCESYYLLWELSGPKDSGNWKTNENMKNGLFAAILLDLYASDKILIQENSGLLSMKVIDIEPTFTFIDRVIFNKLLEKHTYTQGVPISLDECFELVGDICCVTACSNNLRSRGILGVSQANVFDRSSRHPAINIGPVQELERELKAVGLKERRPDSFMLSILTLCLTNENQHSLIDSILELIFSKKECKVAKENINTIVKSQGIVLKSPMFMRKKFSVDVP